jgi:hypothetical protein
MMLTETPIRGSPLDSKVFDVLFRGASKLL